MFDSGESYISGTLDGIIFQVTHCGSSDPGWPEDGKNRPIVGKLAKIVAKVSMLKWKVQTSFIKLFLQDRFSLETSYLVENEKIPN